MGTMPLDEATSSLVEWVSDNAYRLSLRDLALFYAIGGAIFDMAISVKSRDPKYSGMAADMLIDLIRRRR